MHPHKPFTIVTKVIRKIVAAIGKDKSIRPEGISVEILKLGGEAMIPYLARFLDITMNNGTLPSDCKRAIVVPVHNWGWAIIIYELKTG